MGNCTINGVRARCKDAQGNGPYWFCADGGNYSTSVDDDATWGVNNGEDFYSGNINPCISAPNGKNKYTVCIKITTPNLSNVAIDSITFSLNVLNHLQMNPATYPLYASLRTTSASDNDDSLSTFRTHAIGAEASNTTIWGTTLDWDQWSPTFYGDFEPNTSYYLFLYTKSTSNIYGMYMNDYICYDANATYTQTAAEYTVYYDPGTYGSPSSRYYNTKTENVTLTLLQALYSRSGYTQQGWASNPAGTTKVYNLGDSYTANSGTTLYPYWVADSYTINYNKGTYGTGTNTSATKSHGVALTLPDACFTRTGYTQTGWASDAAGTLLLYDLEESCTKNNSFTLYPYWSRNIYTLTINPNGGSMYNGANTTTSTFTISFAYGVKTYLGNLFNSEGVLAAYNDNTPTRAGYTFTGFTFSNGTGQKNTAGAVYYFDGDSPEESSGESGESTSAYIFNGNYAGNVTATANWTGNTYTVKYNANGGTGTTASSTHTYGVAKALTTNGFSRTGYSFTGWNTAANGSGDSYSDKQSVSTLTTGSEIELFAQWGTATYQVIFDANGGTFVSGNFDPQNYIVGSSYTLPTGTITRAGYVFLGWSKTSTATSASYTNGQSGISNLGTAGATVTLYAVWRAKKFTIKYNSNNSNSKSTSTTYTATNSNSIAALPTTTGWTKSGYTASGWSTSSSATNASYAFGQAFNDIESVADGGTLNLYVVWTKDVPWKLTLIKAKFGGVEYTL